MRLRNLITTSAKLQLYKAAIGYLTWPTVASYEIPVELQTDVN